MKIFNPEKNLNLRILKFSKIFDYERNDLKCFRIKNINNEFLG